MATRWIYVKTGPETSQRMELVTQHTLYTVRMPNGSLMEVASDEVSTVNREADDVIEEDIGGGKQRRSHPSFGTIGVSHRSGSRSIHGSRVNSHQNYISIRINAGAFVDHDLGRDWHHSGSQRIVEVALSPARFTEMIASPGKNGGVPCSISYHSPIGGTGMVPEVAEHKTEVAKIVDSIRSIAGKAIKQQAASRAGLELLTAGLSQKKRRGILAAFDANAKVMTETLPFLLESAEEGLEHRVVEATAEIEAAIATGLRSAGIEAIGGDVGRLADHMHPGPAQIAGPVRVRWKTGLPDCNDLLVRRGTHYGTAVFDALAVQWRVTWFEGGGVETWDEWPSGADWKPRIH